MKSKETQQIAQQHTRQKNAENPYVYPTTAKKLPVPKEEQGENRHSPKHWILAQGTEKIQMQGIEPGAGQTAGDAGNAGQFPGDAGQPEMIPKSEKPTR